MFNIMLGMIIDFHTHIFAPDIIENREKYCQQDNCFANLYSSGKAKLATAEQLINIMDEYEIEKAVVLNLGWQSQNLCLKTNDYILESITRYPNRLIGFCMIQPSIGARAVKELERCFKSGAKGIGEMRLDYSGLSLGDMDVLKPIVEIMINNNMILILHTSEPVGHDYPGKGKVTPDISYSFLLKFPDLKIVCAHWGGGLPFYALMPEIDKAINNAFFDTAATAYLYRPAIFRSVLDIIGSEKILFGSDYPLMSPGKILSQINSLDLSKNEQSKILGHNARQLLNIIE